MKKLFVVLTVLVASIVTPVQAKNDSINANKVNYEPVYAGQVVHIAKGDVMLVTGIDSVMVLATDTAKKSEKVAVYADGKKKFTQWIKLGSKLEADSKAKGKFQVLITGGDANTPNGLAIGFSFILLIILVLAGGGYGVYRILRI